MHVQSHHGSSTFHQPWATKINIPWFIHHFCWIFISLLLLLPHVGASLDHGWPRRQGFCAQGLRNGMAGAAENVTDKWLSIVNHYHSSLSLVIMTRQWEAYSSCLTFIITHHSQPPWSSIINHHNYPSQSDVTITQHNQPIIIPGICNQPESLEVLLVQMFWAWQIPLLYGVYWKGGEHKALNVLLCSSQIIHVWTYHQETIHISFDDGTLKMLPKHLIDCVVSKSSIIHVWDFLWEGGIPVSLDDAPQQWWFSCQK